MFASYISVPEFLTFYDVSRWGTENVLQTKLNAAAIETAHDLRQRGFDLSLLMPPKMFDSLDDYAQTSSASKTSDAITGGNEQRFVIDYRSSDSATFSLEGSNDGTVWQSVRGLDGSESILQCIGSGIYSFAFPQAFKQYRYKLTASSSVDYVPYLVDAGADRLIMHKAIMLLLSSYAGSDSPLVLSVYNESASAYAGTLQGLKLNVAESDNNAAMEDAKPHGILFR